MVANTMDTPTQRRWLERHIPYRIRAFEAMRLRGQPYLHPAIFLAAHVVCRVLMDFLCVRVNRNTGVIEPTTKRREPKDVHVIDVGGEPLDLTSLTSEQIGMLTRVYQAAHVAAAHFVEEGQHHMRCPEEVCEAADLLELIIDANLYAKVGMKRPSWAP